MRFLAGFALCAGLLSACNDVTEAVDNTAREGSKKVVIEVLATRYPQVPKELITPFTDCIIDNSKAVEIREFAKAAIVGVDEGTVDTVRSVLIRPETLGCLGTNATALI